MGIYVSKPNTEKFSSDENADGLFCGSSSMQGWRTSQEDAHNTILKFGENTAFFAVYDGHGGSEVAQYTSEHFPTFLQSLQAYKDREYSKALIEGFLSFDQSLLKEEVISKLSIMRADSEAIDEPEEEGEDEDELKELYKEAEMSINDVLKKNYNEAKNRNSDEGSNEGEPSSTSHNVPQSSSSSCNNVGSGSSSIQSSSEDIIDGGYSSKIQEADSPKHIKKVLSDSLEEKTEKVESVGDLSDSTDKVTESDQKVAESADKVTESDQKVEDKSTESDQKLPESAENGADSPDKNEPKEHNGIKEEESSNGDLHYSGKGKSGGKGGKVKGKSSVTTVLSPVEPSRPARKIGGGVNLGNLLNGDDISSDEDDEELDEEEDEELDEEEEEELDEEESDDDDEEDEESERVFREFSSNMTAGASAKAGYDSGCTACVGLLVGNHLFVGNIGDSRCVVSRSGKAVDMSVDHKPEDEIETARIKKAGGVITSDGRINGGLNLSRAFGDHAYKLNTLVSEADQMISPKPDIQELILTPEDKFMIIACDGIWNCMTSQQAVDFVEQRIENTENGKLSSICEEMFMECLSPDVHGDGSGCDNMTCIIIKFDGRHKLSCPSVTSSAQITEKSVNGSTNGLTSSSDCSSTEKVCKRVAEDDTEPPPPSKKPKLSQDV